MSWERWAARVVKSVERRVEEVRGRGGPAGNRRDRTLFEVRRGGTTFVSSWCRPSGPLGFYSRANPRPNGRGFFLPSQQLSQNVNKIRTAFRVVFLFLRDLNFHNG